MRLLLLLACLPWPASSYAQTLTDSLARAYLYNPQLAVERQRLREVDEGVPRALSGWRPHVTLDGSVGVSAVQDSFDKQHNPERRVPQQGALTLNQPIYTGGRVPAQIGQAEALVLAQRATLRASEASVLLAAATAFLDVVRDLRVVALNRGQVGLLERTLRASEQEQAAGAITEADVAQTRARTADGRAALANAGAALARSRAMFEQQVGTPPGELSLPRLAPPLPPGRDAALAQSVAGNFDVAAARANVDAARQGVDVVRAGLYPRLSAQAQAARAHETDVQLPHQSDNVGEATLQLTVPLYQGGDIAAQTRQAREQAVRTQLQVDVALRQARQVISTAWDQLEAARVRIREQRVSVAANEVALRGVTRQQQVGARTLLDVLNAQQELLNANVALVTAEHDELAAAFQVMAGTGTLTAERLALPVPIYDPVRHYDDVRGKWWGTEPPP